MQQRYKIESTYHRELVERTGSLDVLEGLLQVGQLGLNAALGLLGALNSLGLESVNGLELAVHVVGRRLEGLEVVLDLVDHSLVLEVLAVEGKVNGLGLLGKNGELAAGIIVALLEGLQGGSGLAAKAQRGADFGPVDLQGGATLWHSVSKHAILTVAIESRQRAGAIDVLGRPLWMWIGGYERRKERFGRANLTAAGKLRLLGTVGWPHVTFPGNIRNPALGQ